MELCNAKQHLFINANFKLQKALQHNTNFIPNNLFVHTNISLWTSVSQNASSFSYTDQPRGLVVRASDY